MIHEIKCFKTFYIYGENTCHFSNSNEINHRKKKIEKNKRKIRKEIVIMNAIRKMEVKAVLKAGELKNKFLSTKRGSQTFEFLIYAVAAVVFGAIVFAVMKKFIPGILDSITNKIQEIFNTKVTE